MEEFYYLENPIQNYDWGHSRWLSELLGKKNPEEKPEAELWMGAHPKSSSLVLDFPSPGQKTALETLCRENPAAWLGKPDILPYLFKVLAVEKPLSIQVHPDGQTARAGYDVEEAAGIDLDDPTRNYKDPNRKSEIICALTPFYGLCGFLPQPTILMLFYRLLDYLEGDASVYILDAISVLKTEGYAGLMRYFLTVRTPEIDSLVKGLKKYSLTLSLAQAFIINRIARAYPADPAVLFTLVLNPVHLNPGEAVFLPTGILHSYVYGFGVELMTNSDNVLRGGLTLKHIDIPELVKVTAFEPHTPVILQKGPKDKSRVFSFPGTAGEFRLHKIDSSEDPCPLEFPSAAIVLCTGGGLELSGSAQKITLSKGQSVFIPGPKSRVTLGGTGSGFAASASS